MARNSGCGSCGVAANSCGACPGLLHGEIANRFRNAITGGCSSGCGEFYCDEQVNESPTCDPCCGNGEFTGDSCGPCRPLWQRLQALWGTSYVGSCGDGCGSSSCSSGSCSSGSCGNDMYASESDSGYCSNCRDGVAGNPSNHVQHRVQHSTVTPNSTSHETIIDSSHTNTSSPRLEPVADPASDAPVKTSPTKAGRSTSSNKSPSRAIQVPAAQSRLVRQ